MPTQTSGNASYYRTKAKYPWLTHSFVDRVRYQVSWATALLPQTYTRIRFGNNGAHKLQVYHDNIAYDIDLLKTDPLRHARILNALYEVPQI